MNKNSLINYKESAYLFCKKHNKEKYDLIRKVKSGRHALYYEEITGYQEQKLQVTFNDGSRSWYNNLNGTDLINQDHFENFIPIQEMVPTKYAHHLFCEIITRGASQMEDFPEYTFNLDGTKIIIDRYHVYAARYKYFDTKKLCPLQMQLPESDEEIKELIIYFYMISKLSGLQVKDFIKYMDRISYFNP